MQYIVTAPAANEQRARRERVKAPMLPIFPEDEVDLVVFLPFSNLKMYLPEHDLIARARDALDISHLSNKKQLGPYQGYGESLLAFHDQDRFVHSLSTAIIMKEVLRKFNAPPAMQALGQLAGLLHDRGTPAGGDAIKRIDPEALDEEKHWNAELPSRVQQFLLQEGVSESEISTAIMNQGIVGKLLDAADRISYTLTDVWRPGLEWIAYRSSRLGKRHIENLGQIYDDIELDFGKESVIFKDAGRLADFLLLRAEMFCQCYLAPQNVGRDLMLAELVRPFYGRQAEKLLTPSKLRAISDMELYQLIAGQYGIAHPEIHEFLSFGFSQQRIKCSTVEEATAKANTLRSEGYLAGVANIKGFNPSTDFLVRTKRGDIPIGKLIPKVQKRLDEKCASVKSIAVHYSPRPKWMF